MKGIVDRIEEGFYVVEMDDQTMVNIAMGDLPAKEGDVVELEAGMIVTILEDETKERAKTIKSLMDDLFES